MRVMHDRLATPARPALLLVVFGLVGCASPTAADAPVVQLVGQQYTFACGAWNPGLPPVKRTLLDVHLWQTGSGAAPTREPLAALEAAGARVVYRFHGPMVRVELNVAAVSKLAEITTAVTVADPEVRDVSLIVLLSHDLTNTDLQAVQAIGGRVTRQFHTLEGYTIVIDDAQVPAVRALPGVILADFDGVVCIADRQRTTKAA